MTIPGGILGIPKRGNGAGTDANRNAPLEPGSGDDAWLNAVGLLGDDVRSYGAEAIVQAALAGVAAGRAAATSA
jgi:hypothetical protein